jgi:glycosyltransferase involved in cell wall biosynthesis
VKTSLIIPTLNEIDGVRAVMHRINPGWCDEILVVDGGSSDGTVEWLREHGYRVIIQDVPGIGNAYRQAYRHTAGEVIVTFSPDGNSIPELIPALLRKMAEGYDLVIASRYLGAARSEDDDFLTSLGNAFFTRSINLLFGGRYTDALVIFRAYRRDLIDRLGIDAPHMTYEAQISIRAARFGLMVGEISGDEPRRIGGERKIPPFRTGWTILREMGRELRRPRRLARVEPPQGVA